MTKPLMYELTRALVKAHEKPNPYAKPKHRKCERVYFPRGRRKAKITLAGGVR